MDDRHAAVIELVQSAYTHSHSTTADHSLPDATNCRHPAGDITQQAIAASQHDRQQLYGDSGVISTIHLQYGELHAGSYLTVLERVLALRAATPVADQPVVFADLGSGSGSAVLLTALYAAAAQTAIASLIGVELLPSLHQLATTAKQTLIETLQQENSGQHVAALASLQRVSLVNDDLFSADWSTATVLYINSVMFPAEMMQRIGKLCEKLPVHAFAVTTGQPLPPTSQRMIPIVEQCKVAASWPGGATVYIHQKAHNRRAEQVALRAFRR